MPKISKILVPVDFADCSKKALQHAAMLSRHLKASLDVLHVWEPPLYIYPDVLVQIPGEPAQSLAEFAREKAGREMDAFLQEALDAETIAGLNTRVESGHPYQTILDVVKEGQHDLIVMGTHGRKGLPHLLLGSIAEKVVRRAPCPVLTIRSADEDHDVG